MRYRNIEPLSVRKGRGNLRTSAVGRDTSARLFSPSESAKTFEPDLNRAAPPVLMVGRDETKWETFQHEDMPTEWKRDKPIAQMPDTLPVNVLAQDRRRGGTDEYSGSGRTASRRLYTSNDGTTSRELDVSSPTLANAVQVLNALLADMSRESIVVRK
jgi:hypothetical protein